MPTSFTLQQAANSIEADIRARRLLNLPVDWADELIFPAYDGLSIRNVPHTIANLLGAPLDAAILDPRVWHQSDVDGIQRVVMFLSDGLGYQYLRELMDEDAELNDTVMQLTNGSGFVPLTSTAPSTTAVALPTIWTGATPATHGMLGTSLFLREYSMMTNMLFNTSINGMRGRVIPDGDLQTFVHTPALGQHLAQHDIDTHVLLFRGYLGQGILSAVMHRGVTHGHPHLGFSDVWVRLKEILCDTVGQHCYVNIYLGTVDSLAHKYGAKNQYVAYEIKQQIKQLVDILADDQVKDGQTLFIMTADHGHADAPHKIDLQSDDAEPIRQLMRMGLTGDMRLGNLHLQHDRMSDVIDIIHDLYGDYLSAVDTKEAIDARLFGSDTVYAETKHRLGDVILIPRLGTQVIDPSVGVLELESWHGGLSPDEMLVPFMVARV